MTRLRWSRRKTVGVSWLKQGPSSRVSRNRNKRPKSQREPVLLPKNKRNRKIEQIYLSNNCKPVRMAVNSRAKTPALWKVDLGRVVDAECEQWLTLTFLEAKVHLKRRGLKGRILKSNWQNMNKKVEFWVRMESRILAVVSFIILRISLVAKTATNCFSLKAKTHSITTTNPSRLHLPPNCLTRTGVTLTWRLSIRTIPRCSLRFQESKFCTFKCSFAKAKPSMTSSKKTLY